MKKVSNSSNTLALHDAAVIQNETQDALRRIQQQAVETEEVGNMTLAELQEQRLHLDKIMEEGDQVHEKLKTAEKLQSRMSRWAFKFNRGAARKETKKAQRAQEKKEDRKSQRASNLSAPSVEKPVPKQQIVARKGLKKRPKKQEERKPDFKELLYGAAEETKNDEEFHELAKNDAVIDQQMDEIGAQLDNLLALSKTIDTQVQVQSVGLSEVNQQMDEANYKHHVINNRARRFLTGGIRKKYDREAVLGNNRLIPLVG